MCQFKTITIVSILCASLMVHAEDTTDSSFETSAPFTPVAAQETPAEKEKPAVQESPAATVETSNIDPKATYLMCKNKETVRTIRVEKKDNGGCQTIYTKNGKDETAAESSTMPRCLKVLQSIRLNLEKADWKCRDISQARVSSSEAP